MSCMTNLNKNNINILILSDKNGRHSIYGLYKFVRPQREWSFKRF